MKNLFFGGIVWFIISACFLIGSIVQGDFPIEMIFGIVFTFLLGVVFIWVSRK